MHSSRLLSYDQSSVENVCLSKKLNEIKFPQRIPNSPYSVKNITPATPISMMMELKNWLKQNLMKVQMREDISQQTYNFINLASEEERMQVATLVNEILNSNLQQVIEALAEKEGRKGDKKAIDNMMHLYGRDARVLSFRILDELLKKEQLTNKMAPLDFPKIMTREIFLKSLLVCAVETVFFICNVRMMQVHDILTVINLSAFDYWRILNSFLKFDPQMPRVLTNHFREIEIRIVSEAAWQNGSPVVQIIKELSKQA